jgi:CO dehydrogenase maturation factor
VPDHHHDAPDEGPTPREQNLADQLAYREAGLDELDERAENADSPIDACRSWLAVRRQVRRYHRQPATTAQGRTQELLAAHEAAIGHRDEVAAQRLASMDRAARREAQHAMGIRIGVMGKGGAGKSTISSTIARLLARSGRNVLVADYDTNQGVNLNLGLGVVEAGLPPEATVEHPGANYGWRLAPDLTPMQAVQAFSLPAPDGISYLGIGKIEGKEKRVRRSMSAVQQIMHSFAEPGWDVVADFEAGTTGPFERYHDFVDLVLLVVGPEWQSALTARRLLPLIAGVDSLVVANRFSDRPDHDGLSSTVRIPFDPTVSDAERQGTGLIDVQPESPAVAAIAALVEQLTGPGLATPDLRAPVPRA